MSRGHGKKSEVAEIPPTWCWGVHSSGEAPFIVFKAAEWEGEELLPAAVCARVAARALVSLYAECVSSVGNTSSRQSSGGISTRTLTKLSESIIYSRSVDGKAAELTSCCCA